MDAHECLWTCMISTIVMSIYTLALMIIFTAFEYYLSMTLMPTSFDMNDISYHSNGEK